MPKGPMNSALSIGLPVHPSVCLFGPSICPSVHPSACLSGHLKLCNEKVTLLGIKNAICTYNLFYFQVI